MSPCAQLPAKNCCAAGGALVACDPATNDLKVTQCPFSQLGTSVKTSCGWDSSASKYACGFDSADPSGAAVEACPASLCVPYCRGRNCGDDGCGGSCGSCSGGLVQPQPTQTCVSSTCVPSCTGRNCGSDGCGGSCGECASDKVCSGSGQCLERDPCHGVTLDGCCEGRVLRFARTRARCRSPTAAPPASTAASARSATRPANEPWVPLRLGRQGERLHVLRPLRVSRRARVHPQLQRPQVRPGRVRRRLRRLHGHPAVRHEGRHLRRRVRRRPAHRLLPGQRGRHVPEPHLGLPGPPPAELPGRVRVEHQRAAVLVQRPRLRPGAGGHHARVPAPAGDLRLQGRRRQHARVR